MSLATTTSYEFKHTGSTGKASKHPIRVWSLQSSVSVVLQPENNKHCCLCKLPSSARVDCSRQKNSCTIVGVPYTLSVCSPLTFVIPCRCLLSSIPRSNTSSARLLAGKYRLMSSKKSGFDMLKGLAGYKQPSLRLHLAD